MIKISIILSVYNGEKYIKQCIDSILSQTFTEFELIIRNDGSIDNTLSILKSYTDKRIKIINGKNTGVSASRNECIKKIKGTYVAIMDADDIMHPTRLQKQYDYMEKNKNCVVVGCNFDIINENGNVIGNKKLPEITTGKAELGVVMHYIAHPAMMIRTDILKKVGGYDPKIFLAEDKELLYRLSKHGTINNIQQNLLQYRRHKKSITANPLKYFKIAYCHSKASALHSNGKINYTVYITTALLGLRMIAGFIIKNIFLYRK